MERSYSYSIVKLNAHPVRGERLNVGIVVFLDDGLDVIIADRLEKVRAISAAVEPEMVRRSIESLSQSDDLLRLEGIEKPAERVKSLSAMSALEFSSLGSFYANEDRYRSEVERLVRVLLNPEPPLPVIRTRKPKLFDELRSHFASSGVLARPDEDLSSHRVLQNYRFADGMAADFLLKNGKYHVLKIVDLSFDGIHPNKIVQNIAVSALTIEQARLTFGRSETASRILYRVSSELRSLASIPLRAAESQQIEIVNWDDVESRRQLIHDIMSLANPIHFDKNVGVLDQGRLKLN
jgi:hypothetical protein